MNNANDLSKNHIKLDIKTKHKLPNRISKQVLKFQNMLTMITYPDDLLKQTLNILSEKTDAHILTNKYNMNKFDGFGILNGKLYNIYITDVGDKTTFVENQEIYIKPIIHKDIPAWKYKYKNLKETIWWYNADIVIDDNWGLWDDYETIQNRNLSYGGKWRFYLFPRKTQDAKLSISDILLEVELIRK